MIVKVLKSYPELIASKIRRVYQNEEFSIWKRDKKRRLDNPTNPITVPLNQNSEWAMDFVTDVLVNGNKSLTLIIVDQYDRKYLKIENKSSVLAWRVINILNQAIEGYVKPSGIRTDDGLEFTSHLFQNWLKESKIEWVKIQKGKPQKKINN